MTDGATVAWSELLGEATSRFERASIETAAMDARRIVEEITGVEPAQFHTVLDAPATERGVARFDTLVGRRALGEPLQYVLGRWGFRSLDLMLDRRVLIPRPETEVVAGLAIDLAMARSAALPDRDVMVADLGTGSGAIALSIAVECPRSRVLAVDASDDALAVARANLAGIGRVATRVSLHHGDWFAALPPTARGDLDVVVANPPYVGDGEVLPAVVVDWEPTGALRAGADGLADLRRIVDQAPEWLNDSGSLVLEMAPDQTDTVALWCVESGFRATIHKDLSGRSRAVVAER